ncbi:MAG: C39 family peptidase [Clostridia bacterium]|nr:C39 family peptidase [Clostridia bacterium]
MRKHSLIFILGLLLIIFSILLVSCGTSVPVSKEPESSDTEFVTLPPVTETDAPTGTDAPPDTEKIYDLSVDPDLYEPVPEKEYGLKENALGISTAFTLGGKLQSATGTSLGLVIEWEAIRNVGDSFAMIHLDIAVEHRELNCKNFSGVVRVNGEEYEFMSPFYEYSSNELVREWLCPIEVKIPCGYGEETFVDIYAFWDFDGYYEGRIFDDGIEISGTVPIGEKYAAIKTSDSLTVENILQLPDLPEGCEVTSLAIVLKYLGFDVSHTYLADNYLPKGNPGKVSPYEMNIGDPRDKGRSWGCYAPVIVETANKFLFEAQSYYRAFNLTGYDINELWYQVSMGHPVIVWVTMDFASPYLKTPWNIGEEKFYWKYPLHCVVLSGYDLKNGTVEVTDPLKEDTVTVDMELFTTRFRQMEAQAVVVKNSRSK